MMQGQPFNAKSSLDRIFQSMVIASCAILILYFGKVLFVPLLFGLLVALVMYPVCAKMEKAGLSRSLSVTIVLSFVVLLFLGLIWLLAIELNIFLRDFPLVSDRLMRLTPDVKAWVQQTFGVSEADQTAWLAKLNANLDQDITSLIKSALNTTVATVVMLIMIPIYAALFLYHRETFVRFLERVIPAAYKKQLHPVLQESVFSYFNFVKGNFYVYCIVGILNSLGLLALGIRNAVLYGMLTSFMMVIPYIGIFISASIPVSIALVTKDSIWYPIAVVAIFVFIQYLESNVIFPRVVGMQLDLSTWSTLVAIVAATVLWGLSGMVLVTPFLAILKIVTDHVPEWKALNVLLNRSEGYRKKQQAVAATRTKTHRVQESL